MDRKKEHQFVLYRERSLLQSALCPYFLFYNILPQNDSSLGRELAGTWGEGGWLLLCLLPVPTAHSTQALLT